MGFPEMEGHTAVREHHDHGQGDQLDQLVH